MIQTRPDTNWKLVVAKKVFPKDFAMMTWSGCDVTTSHGVQTTWNPLEPPSESSPGRPEGQYYWVTQMGRTFPGGER
jgi:hypothetical protein